MSKLSGVLKTAGLTLSFLAISCGSEQQLSDLIFTNFDYVTKIDNAKVVTIVQEDAALSSLPIIGTIQSFFQQKRYRVYADGQLSGYVIGKKAAGFGLGDDLSLTTVPNDPSQTELQEPGDGILLLKAADVNKFYDNIKSLYDGLGTSVDEVSAGMSGVTSVSDAIGLTDPTAAFTTKSLITITDGSNVKVGYFSGTDTLSSLQFFFISGDGKTVVGKTDTYKKLIFDTNANFMANTLYSPVEYSFSSGISLSKTKFTLTKKVTTGAHISMRQAIMMTVVLDVVQNVFMKSNPITNRN